MHDESDDTTPCCRFCGEPHVGIGELCYLALRGAFMVPPKIGYEIFVLDTRAKLELITLENGQQALVVDVDKHGIYAAAVHENCVDEAKSALATVSAHFHDADDDDIPY